MPRQARKKSKSGIYHVMLRGINHQILFEDDEDREKLLDVIKTCKEKSGYKVYGYCLMDNHVHLLIQEEDEQLDSIMKRIGVSYVYWYNWKYNRTGHLFQDRYKSEPVETDEYFLTVLRYIHQNPIKAGLVSELCHYRWSSYNAYINLSGMIDRDFALGIFNNKEKQLKEYLNDRQLESTDQVLEIEETKRLSDQKAKLLIQEEIGTIDFAKVQEDKRERDELLKRIKKIEGLSLRQIARITGYTVNVVVRA